MREDSYASNPPLLLEYYKTKIQIPSVFSWKPALEMPQYVKIGTNLLISKSTLLEVKLLELWRKTWQSQLNLENVGAYDIKTTLQGSHIVTVLQFNLNIVWWITCLPQYIVSVVSSKRPKCVFFSCKQPGEQPRKRDRIVVPDKCSGWPKSSRRSCDVYHI